MKASLTAIAVVTLLFMSTSNGCTYRPTPSRVSSAAGGSDSNQGGSGGQGGGASVGLPCDLQTILVDHCDSCHGATLAGGAPRSLVTFADLTKPDLVNNTMTEAQAALQRIQSTTAPMPPSPASTLTSTEIATLQNWIASGYPAGSCGGGGGAGGCSQTGGGGGAGAGGSPQSGSGGAVGAADAGVAGGGLPCDVQTLLVNRCDTCHGTTPAAGAPRSLVTYADLTKPDPVNTAMTEAQVALARMQSATSPMPPAPASAATSSEIATLQNWINGGYTLARAAAMPARLPWIHSTRRRRVPATSLMVAEAMARGPCIQGRPASPATPAAAARRPLSSSRERCTRPDTSPTTATASTEPPAPGWSSPPATAPASP